MKFNRWAADFNSYRRWPQEYQLKIYKGCKAFYEISAKAIFFKMKKR